MIRLIASDLDGTLLRGGAQRVDPEMFLLIGRLRERGIAFAAASGRQYPNLRRLFAPVWKEIFFIAENGNLIMRHGEALEKREMSRALGLELLADIARHGLPSMLSGEQTLYLKGDDPDFIRAVLLETRNTITIVDDYAEVDEPFLKISAYCRGGIAPYAQPLTTAWEKQVHAAVSGRCWIDFTESNKGEGIGFLQQRFGYRKEEIIAFGDNYNDAQMLEAAGRGYLMETAAAELRERFPLRCTRVEDTIRQLLDEGML